MGLRRLKYARRLQQHFSSSPPLLTLEAVKVALRKLDANSDATKHRSGGILHKAMLQGAERSQETQP